MTFDDKKRKELFKEQLSDFDDSIETALQNLGNIYNCCSRPDRKIVLPGNKVNYLISEVEISDFLTFLRDIKKHFQ